MVLCRVGNGEAGETLGSAVYLAYVKWCTENDAAPMSPQAFGRGGSWKKKEKTGGNVYYLDAVMKEGASIGPSLKVVGGSQG